MIEQSAYEIPDVTEYCKQSGFKQYKFIFSQFPRGRSEISQSCFFLGSPASGDAGYPWLMEATLWSLQLSSYSPPLVCLCPNALLKKTLVFELGPTQSIILTNYIWKDSVC